jgi:hypothetical protein
MAPHSAVAAGHRSAAMAKRKTAIVWYGLVGWCLVLFGALWVAQVLEAL